MTHSPYCDVCLLSKDLSTRNSLGRATERLGSVLSSDALLAQSEIRNDEVAVSVE